MEVDDNNVDDLYRVARRKRPEGIAQAYWDDTINGRAMTTTTRPRPRPSSRPSPCTPTSSRPWRARPSSSWGPDLAAQEPALHLRAPRGQRVTYESVKREARDSGSPASSHPSPRSCATSPSTVTGTRSRPRTGATRASSRPAAGRSASCRPSCARPTLWPGYRNSTGGPNALRIPYRDAPRDRALYPDFVLFHRTDQSVQPSIVDPHG